jgi:hypothetical protein
LSRYARHLFDYEGLSGPGFYLESFYHQRSDFFLFLGGSILFLPLLGGGGRGSRKGKI